MLDNEIRDILMKVSFNEDKSSFKKLYFHFYSDMLRLAQSFVKINEAAEEIVDDAFVKIWCNRSKLYQVNNIKVYLFVCIKNLCINYIEKHKNIHIISIEDIDFEPEDNKALADQKLHLADMQGIINRAISQLTPQCRLIFQLVKNDGLKHREVAEVLNISVKTVEYHIGNALKKISEKLTLLFNNKN